MAATGYEKYLYQLDPANLIATTLFFDEGINTALGPVAIKTPDSVKAGGAFSIELEFSSWEITKTTFPEYRNVIFSNRRFTNSYGFALYLSRDTGGEGDHCIVLNVRDTSTSTISNSNVWEAETPYHLVLTNDPDSGDAKVYLNGNLLITAPAITASQPVSEYGPQIGAEGRNDSAPENTYPFSGEIVNVAIFDRVLTSSDVTNNFQAWLNGDGGQDAAQSSKVSGIVQIDGTPAQRTVRAFGYNPTVHDLDGETINLSKSLGHATSDPTTGEYTIDLLRGYFERIFVVAFDDYGADFAPNLAVAVGDRVHPSTPNGHVWECTGAGTLPSEEPTWIVDTETAQLYGTASMIAKPFYRPMVHGPVAPEVFIDPLIGKYWRVRSLSNGGGTSTSIALINFFEQGGTGSHNRPITVASGNFADNPELAFEVDLSAASQWKSTDAEPWIGCIFEDATRVSTVEIWPSSDAAELANLPTDFVIESSIDGQEWQTAATITGASGWQAGMPQQFTVQEAAIASDATYRDMILGYEPTAFYDPAGGALGQNFGLIGGNLVSPHITERYGVKGISRSTSSESSVNSQVLIPGTEYTILFFFATTRTTFTTLAGHSGGGSSDQSGILYTNYPNGSRVLVVNQLTSNAGSYNTPEGIADGQWHVAALSRRGNIREGYIDGTRDDVKTGIGSALTRSTTAKITALIESDGGYRSPNETTWLGLMAYIPTYLSEPEIVALSNKIKAENGLA